MIFYDFCLLLACFHYEIINVWNLESHMHIADRCAPRKSTNGAENLILQALLTSIDMSIFINVLQPLTVANCIADTI
jgi:hypothetical protein